MAEALEEADLQGEDSVEAAVEVGSQAMLELDTMKWPSFLLLFLLTRNILYYIVFNINLLYLD